MNILFTTFAYHPETSGVPIVVKYLAEGLARLGHKVSVATRKNGKQLPDYEVIDNVSVYRFSIGQDLYKRNTGDVDKYIQFVMDFQMDVLVMECLQCHTTDVLLPYLSRIKCRKFLHTHGAPGILMKPIEWEGDLLHTIGHLHNWFRWKKYYNYTLPKYVNEFSSGICLSLCASDMQYLSEHSCNVCIAENAADDMFFDETKYELPISHIINIKNNRYVVNISNYSDRKNQLLLLKSYKLAGLKNISLVLIGSSENSYQKKCLKFANKLNEEGFDIHILHNIDRKFFPSIIYHADLFTMTSKWEEYPVSLVEAMAVGTPFLCTPVGNAHILPGGITSRNNGEIPSLLRNLLSNSNLLSRLAKQGKDYALNNNSLSVVLQNFNSIIKA